MAVVFRMDNRVGHVLASHSRYSYRHDEGTRSSGKNTWRLVSYKCLSIYGQTGNYS